MNADEWHATKPGADTAIALAMANVLLNERVAIRADANAPRCPLRIHSRKAQGDQRRRRRSDPPGGSREFASARPSLSGGRRNR